MPDSVTYRKQLYPLGHGYPLWCPAPSENLPTAYRDDGMRIGDVGLLTSGGGFDYLWNVHYPHDHPINLNIDGSTRVPLEDNAPQPPLSPLNENDDRQVRVHSQHHNPHTCIASSTINARQLSADMTVDPAILGCLAGGGAAFEFSTVHDASAALVLPLGARRVDAVRLSEYQQYAAKHATSWYRFVKNELRRDMESGTLYLVTGTDKCFSWGATAVSRSGSNNALSLKFFAANIASTSVGFRNSWLQSIGASTRIGEEDTMNQCVFSRGFVISIKTHRKLLSWNSKSAEVRLEVTTDTQGGADAKKPRASGSGGPVSSIRRWFGSSGGAKEAGEDIERDDGERTSTEIDMDESNVDVFPFPSYDVPKHPAALIGEDLLRKHADTDAAIVHDDECLLLASLALREDKDLLEIYQGENESGCTVRVENGVCMFVTEGWDMNDLYVKEGELFVPKSSLRHRKNPSTSPLLHSPNMTLGWNVPSSSSPALSSSTAKTSSFRHDEGPAAKRDGYICSFDKCGKVFQTAILRRIHEDSVHDDDGRYHCLNGCGETFKHASSASRHKRDCPRRNE